MLSDGHYTFPGRSSWGGGRGFQADARSRRRPLPWQMRRDKEGPYGRGVFRLNQGSTPWGRSSIFRQNLPGGAFGSGRTAGGGAGAGVTLAQSLMMPATSVRGNPVVGPPPVDPFSHAGPPEAAPPPGPRPPAFDPRPIPNPIITPGGVKPIFDPNILGGRRPGGGASIRFF